MTTDYSALPAGRELDALVAEKVMGFHWEGRFLTPQRSHQTFAERHFDGRLIPGGLLPRYSTDFSAAWGVVEEMERRGFHGVVRTPFTPEDGYHAGYTPHGSTGWNGRPDHRGSGETAPLAICRAALAAVQPSDVPPEAPDAAR
jgi:ABA sandwich protein